MNPNDMTTEVLNQFRASHEELKMALRDRQKALEGDIALAEGQLRVIESELGISQPEGANGHRRGPYKPRQPRNTRSDGQPSGETWTAKCARALKDRAGKEMTAREIAQIIGAAQANNVGVHLLPWVKKGLVTFRPDPNSKAYFYRWVGGK